MESKALLNAIPDISYIVDREYRIIAYNQKPWNEFALHNRAARLQIPSHVIGKSILDFMEGQETRESYRKYLDMVFAGEREKVIFPFRCDAPDKRRFMRMHITPVIVDEEIVAVLFHSLLIKEEARQRAESLTGPVSNGVSRSLQICSYCKNVKPQRTEVWMTIEDYEQQFGNEPVIQVHTICPVCKSAIVDPLIHQSRQFITESMAKLSK